LFLDEPTVGLDAQTRARIWAYLGAQQRERGLTLLTTTHYIEEVEGADTVCIIDHGRILAEGAPATLKRDLGHAFLHVLPTGDADRVALLAAYPQAHPLAEGWLAVPAGDEGFVPAFLARF